MRWWFKRPAKNRRLKPEGGLETLSTRRQASASRWRTTLLAMIAAAGALAALVAVWRAGDWCMRRFVYENPAFALRHIDIQTDGVISTEQLRLWAGINPGDNLLAVDLPQIKRHLELSPLIREVSVERIMPATLKIRVTEREPMVQAYVLAPKSGESGFDIAVYYLDDEGYVMKPMDSPPRGGAAQENYAVLTGLGRADLRPGRKAESPQVYASLRLLETFARSPMLGVVDLARIDISTPEVLLVTTSQGAEIVFGMENLETQLRRWRAIHDFGLKQGKQIASLDLSVTNNIPALWVETNQIPVVLPKPVKTSRTRNKHV
jgi:hypothetical protein